MPLIDQVSEPKLESPATAPTSAARLVGVGLVGLLALTACSSDDDDDAASSEATAPAEESVEEPETPDTDDDTDAGAGANSETILLEEIIDDSFTAMREAETATVRASADEEMAEELENLEDAPTGDGEELFFTASGAIDGSATSIELSMGGLNFDMLMSDGRTFMSGETLLATMMMQESIPGIDYDAVADQLAGRWVASDTEEDGEMTILAMLDELEESYRGSDNSFPEGSVEGELTDYDGHEAWLFSSDEVDLYISADEDAPYMLAYLPSEDADVPEAIFSDWDNAPTAEAPSEDLIITEDQIPQILMGSLG